MYIPKLPSTVVEFGCLSGTNKLVASFDDVRRAQEHCNKMDPSGEWRVVEMVHRYRDVTRNGDADEHETLRLVETATAA